MRILLGLLCIAVTANLSGVAYAGQAERTYSSGADRFLSITGSGAGSVEFTLSVGVGEGEARCAEGDVSCLTVMGEAKDIGSMFAYSDSEGGEITFKINPDSVEVVSATGTLGTGTGNVQQLSVIAGVYMLVAQQDADVAPQRDDIIFQTPSGNISCVIVSDPGGFVRCDMRQLTQTHTKRPGDCDLDWGTAFGIAADGNSGEVICHGDTLFGTEPMKLDYGKSIEASGFLCFSEKTGLTCRNSAGHGFTLSKARQKLF
jgi:hypothetical protein